MTTTATREKSYRICKDYLNGAWKNITSDKMVLKQISGGLSNFLYYCALPPGTKNRQKEPTKVLLRFYGQVHGERALESLVADSVIFALLSERKLGPHLHGIFPGGRIEEFIPARPLSTRELSDPELSGMIAEKLASIHTLNVPLIKEPTWIWETISRWLLRLEESVLAGSKDPVSHQYAEQVRSMGLKKEIIWLKKYLTSVNSPVVFCHNDFQEGNILYRESPKTWEDKLVIIDFEYCSYNYRGFDLANHFCEWMIDNVYGKSPGFLYSAENEATKEQKLLFIRQYIRTTRDEMGIDDDDTKSPPKPNGSSNSFSSRLNEDFILGEIERFTLGSHFFWGLWGIVNATTSTIPFGYWEYAVTRLTAYYDLKSKLVPPIASSREMQISE